MQIEIFVQSKEELDMLLAPQLPQKWAPQMIPPDTFLKEVLLRANALIPSHAGAVLLWDKQKRLVFSACFGEHACKLVGQSIACTMGIAGQVFMTGKAYISTNVSNDPFFYAKFDKILGLSTESIICAPVYDTEKVIGVIELLFRGEHRYSERDLKILEIFSEYTSLLFKNALYARLNHWLACRDDLSGLYNDRHFHVFLLDLVNKAQKEGHDVGLIFFDLDRFKQVVDTYGHIVGARLLAELGWLLKQTITDTRAHLFRYGGDEFVVILEGAALEETKEVGEVIREMVEKASFLKEMFHPRGIGQSVTVSVGIASLNSRFDEYSDTEAIKEGLIHAADNAMYQAKGNGRNQVCVAENWRVIKGEALYLND